MEHDDTASKGTSSAPEQGRYPTKLRRNFPRSRSGCLTCRQRKKKCDEIKPACSGCRRNELKCTWPTSPSIPTCTAHEARVASTETRQHNDGSLQHENEAYKRPANGRSSLVSRRPNDGPNAISWYQSIGSFTSQNRAAMLTPCSGMLLGYYITETAPTMTTWSGSGNPCLSSVLPIAYIDDLVMHGVMAMGGTHLCSGKEANAQLKSTTESHYACVLRGVRLALHDLQPDDTEKALRILSVLMLVAHYEACTSTCNSGSIFSHLRASRQLILWLLSLEHQLRSDARYIFGYLLEMYIYLVMANSIIPYGIMDGRHVPYDAFLDSLVTTLGTYDTFGIMFAGCHELFEMIPAISRFAAQRLKEEETQPQSVTNVPERDPFYAQTKARIRDWRSSQPQSMEANEMTKRMAIGETYRHALFIYLETAVLGTAGLPPTADVNGRLYEHISRIGEAVQGHDLVTSAFATILLWPMIIAGSVLVQAEERDVLTQGLRMPLYATCNSVQMAELLELVWGDEDPRSFGSYGLYLAMERHGINLCLS